MVSTLAIICSAVYAQAVRGYLFQTDASPLVCFAAEMSDSIQTKANRIRAVNKSDFGSTGLNKAGMYTTIDIRIMKSLNDQIIFSKHEHQKINPSQNSFWNRTYPVILVAYHGVLRRWRKQCLLTFICSLMHSALLMRVLI